MAAQNDIREPPMSLVVLASVPTPSRTVLYDALAEEAGRAGRRFHVLYCAKREQGANEAYDSATMRHAHTVLRGFHPSLTGMQAHLNPGVLAELNLLKPDTLIVAGPWQTPTMLLAGLNIYSPPPRRLYLMDSDPGVAEKSSRVFRWLRRLAYRRYVGFIAAGELSAETAKAQADELTTIFRLPPTGTPAVLAKVMLSHLYPS